MSITIESDEADVNPERIDYAELRAAIKKFHEDRKLGTRGFGAVYWVRSKLFV